MEAGEHEYLMEQLLTEEVENEEKTIDFWETELVRQKEIVKNQSTDFKREILEKLSFRIQH